MSEVALGEAGLSKNEARVYLALLRLGTTGVRSIIEASGLHSANVYAALTRLARRGLIGEVRREGKRYYEAGDPRALLGAIHERERTLEALLPALGSLRQEGMSRAEATVLQGKEGLRTMLEDILREGADYYAVTSRGHVYEFLGQPYLARFHRVRVRKGMWRNILYGEEAHGTPGTRPRPLSRIRYLPRQFASPAALYTYGEKAALVIVEAGKIFVFILRSKGVADSFRSHWKLLYSLAKP